MADALSGPVGDLPAEAVEAAAKVSFGFVWRTRPIAVSWEDAEESIRREYRADARSVLAAALPLIRAQIADELREVRPGLPWHPSREQESFQRGYDAAVHQLDLAVARGAGRG